MPKQTFPLQLKQVEDSGSFRGLVSVYGNVDRQGDVVERGAFRRQLEEDPEVPILYQHDTSEPIGKGRLSDSSDGLVLDGTLNLDVQRARETHSNMKMGVIRGLSIGYDAADFEINDEGNRRLKDVAVWEASPVVFPANPEARITAVKETQMSAQRPFYAMTSSRKRLTWRDKKRRAFTAWATKGEEGLTPEESKFLRRSDDPQAGVLLPEEIEAGIIAELVEMSPVRQFATVRQTTGDSLTVFRKVEHSQAEWVAETESRPDTQEPKYGKLRVPVHELFAKAVVSNQIIEDAAIDLAEDLQMDLADQFAQAEGRAFVDGNGTDRPLGILQAIGSNSTDEIEEVQGVGSGSVAQDDPSELQAALKQGHFENARFFFNRRTLRDIRQLTDSNGQFLFRPLVEGAGNQLAGSPFTILPDLPDPATGEHSVLFGDMSRGYLVVDRFGIEIQRDPFTMADDGAVIFRARMRVGGHVRLPEALKALRVG